MPPRKQWKHDLLRQALERRKAEVDREEPPLKAKRSHEKPPLEGHEKQPVEGPEKPPLEGHEKPPLKAAPSHETPPLGSHEEPI